MKQLLFAIGLLSVFVSCSAPTVWSTYENKVGRFKISMPGKPAESERELPSAVGPLTAHIAALTTTNKDEVMFMTMYTDYPDSMINSNMGKERTDEFFDGAINSVRSKGNSTIAKKESVKYNGYPGIHVLIDKNEENGKKTKFEVVMFLIKNRGYIMLTSCYVTPQPPTPTKQFFNSFQASGI